MATDRVRTTTPGRRGRTSSGRRRLLGASAMVAFGAFLPWVQTAVGSVAGVRGAGLWTFYAAALGLAGALVPWRRLSAAQGAVLGLVALGLGLWQVVHLYRLVGLQGWMPGPGLVLTIGGGVLALVAARALLREGGGAAAPAGSG